MADTHNEFRGTALGPLVQSRDIGQLHIHTPVPSPTALAGLPTDEGLTGRTDQLALLAGILSPEHEPDGPAICTIAGLGGVGKTALAVRAARRATADGWFPGGVLFVDLFGYDPVRRKDAVGGLSALLRALGVPGEHIPREQTDLEVLYRSWLDGLAEGGQAVLVLVDNASTPDHVLPLRPGHPLHRMLVTSRHTLPVPGARRLELDVLPDADAVAVLDRALRAADPDDTRVTGAPDAAARLVHLCDGLPLALRIIAQVLADQPDRPLAELVDGLAAEHDRLGEFAYGHALAVRVVFDASYRHLPAEEARLFRLLAVNPCPEIDLDAASAIADQPPTTTRRLMAELRRAHLVQPVSGGYRIHDLVYLYAAERFDADESDDGAVHRLLNHYLTAATAAEGHLDPRVPVDSSRFADRAQALAWLDAQRANLVAAVELAGDAGDDVMVTRLAAALTPYFDLRREPHDWATTSRLAIAAAQRSGDRSAEASGLNALGMAYRGLLGMLPDAVDCFTRAGNIYRDIGDNSGAAAALTNLGNAQDDLGHLTDAVDSHQRAAALYEELDDLYGVAIALANQGNAEKGLGRFAEALEHYEEASADFFLCSDVNNAAKTQDNITSVHLAMGDDDEAADSHRQALTLFRRLGDLRGEAQSLVGLAAGYAQRERFADAVDQYRQAVALWRNVGDRFEEGQAMTRLSWVYWRLGRMAEALDTGRAVLTIHEETGNTYGTGTILSYLGVFHRDLGERDTALDCYRRSITAFEEAGSVDEAANVRSLVDELDSPGSRQS